MILRDNIFLGAGTHGWLFGSQLLFSNYSGKKQPGPWNTCPLKRKGSFSKHHFQLRAVSCWEVNTYDAKAPVTLETAFDWKLSVSPKL